MCFSWICSSNLDNPPRGRSTKSKRRPPAAGRTDAPANTRPPDSASGRSLSGWVCGGRVEIQVCRNLENKISNNNSSQHFSRTLGLHGWVVASRSQQLFSESWRGLEVLESALGDFRASAILSLASKLGLMVHHRLVKSWKTKSSNMLICVPADTKINVCTLAG